MTFLESFMDKADDLSWMTQIVMDGNGSRTLEFETWSPAGEDMVIEIELDEDSKTDNAEEVLKYLAEYAGDFNPDEHACEWYGKGRGEPDSLQALLDDANEQKRMYEDLYKAALKAYQKTKKAERAEQK